MAPQGVKFDKLNWLQAGILTCDKVLTVSPNYAYEICRDVEMGVELDDKLRAVGGVEGYSHSIYTIFLIFIGMFPYSKSDAPK